MGCFKRDRKTSGFHKPRSSVMVLVMPPIWHTVRFQKCTAYLKIVKGGHLLLCLLQFTKRIQWFKDHRIKSVEKTGTPENNADASSVEICLPVSILGAVWKRTSVKIYDKYSPHGQAVVFILSPCKLPFNQRPRALMACSVTGKTGVLPSSPL